MGTLSGRDHPAGPDQSSVQRCCPDRRAVEPQRVGAGRGHCVENNLLTIRGERKFEKKVSEENYLRVERSFGSFARSFTLANTVNTDAIKAGYQNGVLTLSIPKREEAKPKQIEVTVNAPAVAAAASGK